MLHQKFGINSAVFGLQHDTDVMGRLIADVVQQRKFFLLKQRGNFFNQFGFLNLIRNFLNDYLILAVAQVFGFPAGTDTKITAAGFIGFQNACKVVYNNTAGREIGAFQAFDQRFDFAIRIFNLIKERVANLTQIVRRNIGGHTNGNTGSSVAQQIGNGCRHNDGFVFFSVVSFSEINRVFVQPFHQSHGKFGQAGFGITHGGRTVSVNIAEVALPVNQRIAYRKILCQTCHCLINCGISVRMVFTDNVADNAGAFFEA